MMILLHPMLKVPRRSLTDTDGRGYDADSYDTAWG